MRYAGFSLLELLIVLLVVATLLAIGVPALGRLALDHRRTADINAFVTAVQLARSESAKRPAAVTLCPSADGSLCGGPGGHFDSGWIVFVNEDRDSPAQRDPDEPLLHVHLRARAATVRSNRARYTFRPFYIRSTNGTVTFCDERGPAAARAVILSYTGRPRVSDRGPGGRALECAD
jgi:type IV fimbrial biogenesis protein FimT